MGAELTNLFIILCLKDEQHVSVKLKQLIRTGNDSPYLQHSVPHKNSNCKLKRLTHGLSHAESSLS